MINKKRELGREPEELGLKDAVHVAIVSVQAASPIEKGEMVEIGNNFSAYPASDKSKAFGVADPFRNTQNIRTGQFFWVLAMPNEVQSVSHVWENPKVDNVEHDKSKKIEKLKNKYIEGIATELKLDYDFLMDAADRMMKDETKTDVNQHVEDDYLVDYKYDFWPEWAAEVGYKFANHGSECCPEYDYPEFPINFNGE